MADEAGDLAPTMSHEAPTSGLAPDGRPDLRVDLGACRDLKVGRDGNLWTYNGIGRIGATIIAPDRHRYLYFESAELDPALAGAEPVPSPWYAELYFAANGVVSLFRPQLHGWKPIVPDIHAKT